jgi:hypothetical protein
MKNCDEQENSMPLAPGTEMSDIKQKTFTDNEAITKQMQKLSRRSNLVVMCDDEASPFFN